MTDNETIKFLDNSYSQLLNLIKMCDQKIGFLLALHGIFIAGFINNLHIINKLDYLLFVLLCISASLLLCAINPRFISIDYTNSNLLFFGSIIRHDNNSFYDILKKKKEEDIIHDYINQIISNSHIVNQKFKLFNYSIKLIFGIIVIYAIKIIIP